jgi:hypothetical protein
VLDIHSHVAPGHHDDAAQLGADVVLDAGRSGQRAAATRPVAVR